MKIARHICNVHSEEPEVASLPAVPKTKSTPKGLETARKRGFALGKLRNMGDFNYNLNVLLSRKGTLILGRMATTGYVHNAEEYIPCKYCLVFFFYKKELWRHAAHCAFRTAPLNPDDRKEARQMLEEGQLLLKGAGVKVIESDLDSDFLELVLKAMQSDHISTAVKSDSLILQLGKSLFDKLGRMRAGDVRSRLRNLVRLKLEIRKVAKLPINGSVSRCYSTRLV